MRSFLQLFENVQQSKQLLHKLKIPLDHSDYLTIRNMIKGHDGYAYWLTKLRFSDNIPMEEIKDVWNTIKNNKNIISLFTSPPVTLENLEKFHDEFAKAKIKYDAKSVLDQFPHLQKSFFDIDEPDDLSLLKKLSDHPSLSSLTKKISSYKDKKSLLDAANRLISSQTSSGFIGTMERIKSTGAEIIISDPVENIIITRVNYDQIVKLGGDTAWCIVRARSTFDSYANGGFQYIVYLLDENGNKSKIGVTTAFDYLTAHDRSDHYISKDSLVAILSERGVDFKILCFNKEKINSINNWNNFSVELLIQNGFTKEEILKRKETFRPSKSYSVHRQQPSKNDIYFFSQEEIEKYKLLDRSELEWEDLLKMDKEYIISKNCINRVRRGVLLSKVFQDLKMTKEDVLKHDIFKFCVVDSESLGYFTKDELVRYKIINLAQQIDMGYMMSIGFTKDEIIKKYPHTLTGETASIISHFGKLSKKEILYKLGSMWSNDWIAIGVGDSSEAKEKAKLNVMTIFEIGPKDIPLISDSKRRGISNYFTTGHGIPKTKACVGHFFNLGYEVNSKDDLDIFMKIFRGELTEYIGSFFTAFQLWLAVNESNKEVGKMIQTRISNKIENMIFEQERYGIMQYNTNVRFNYWSLIKVQNSFNSSRYPDFLRSVFEKCRIYLSDNPKELRTGYREDSSSWDADTDSTIRYMEFLGFGKSDIDSYVKRSGKSIYSFCGKAFESTSSYNISKVIKLLETYGYKLSDEDKIKIIEACLKDSYHKNHTGEKEYSESYYICLLERGLDIENSREHLLKSISNKKEIADSDVNKFTLMFKDKGEWGKWENPFKEAINKVKNVQRQYVVYKSIDEIIGRNTNYKKYSGSGYSKENCEMWFDEFFDEYKNLSISKNIYRSNEIRTNIKVLLLLCKIGKLDEASNILNIKEWKKMIGESFDNNILHTLAKIICQSGSTYWSNGYDKFELSIDERRLLYKWVISQIEIDTLADRYLQACYLIFDRKRYDKYIESVGTVKDNYQYHVISRKTKETEERFRTIRISAVKYILSRLATTGQYEEFKRIVNKVFSYADPNCPRSLKMSKQEFKDSLEILGYVRIDNYYKGHADSQEFKKIKDDIISEIVKKYTPTVVKESRLVSWKEFIY